MHYAGNGKQGCLFVIIHAEFSVLDSRIFEGNLEIISLLYKI